MSAENVAIAQQATDAFNRRDLEAWLAVHDGQIEWHPATDEPESGSLRGHDDLAKMLARLFEVFPDIRAEATEYIDRGEYVISVVRYVGHAGGSDADVVIDEAYVAKFGRKKIVEVREYRTREEAVDAVVARSAGPPFCGAS